MCVYIYVCIHMYICVYIYIYIYIWLKHRFTLFFIKNISELEIGRIPKGDMVY